MHQFDIISEAPSVAHVLAIVGTGVSWRPTPKGAGEEWPEGLFCRAYYHGVSSTGVVVGWEQEQFVVRISSLACTADHELAQHIIRSLARALALPIHYNRGYPRSTREIATDFGRTWAHDLQVKAPRTLIQRVLSEGHTVRMRGTTRDVYVNRATAAQLNDGPEHALHTRFYALCRSVLYPSPSLHQPNVMYVQHEASTTQVAVWSPGSDYFFPAVKTYLLAGPTLRWLHRSVAVREGLVHHVDAEHCIATCVALDDWPAFLAQVGPLCSPAPFLG